MNWTKLEKIFTKVVDGQVFNKIVFSKPTHSDYKKTEVRLFQNKQQVYIQLTHYLADNKVLHDNFAAAVAGERLMSLMRVDYQNCVIMTDAGNCDIKRLGTERLVITNKIARTTAVKIVEHDATKQDYISGIAGSRSLLRELDLADERGELLPSRRHKYNQANKFVEVLAGMVAGRDYQRQLNVVDLCCGKAYLSILAHNYFLAKGYNVNTVGVDLKPDVVQTCKTITTAARMSGIDFIHNDINSFIPPWPDVDVTMSLHACNTATDMVLFNALRYRSTIILCSPCCHHELAQNFDERYLPEITQYPLLKQRFCELATDAIRANILRAFGYTVQIIEFVDKEDSHKNSLIKAVRNENQVVNPASLRRDLKVIDSYCDKLGVRLSLRKYVEKFCEVVDEK